MGVLTDAEQATFRREGYLVLDSGLTPEVIDGIVDDLDGRYPTKVQADGVLPPTRIQDAWKVSTNVHQAAVAPRLLQALRELFHREPLPFQTLNFPTGTLQPAHADSVHFNSAPAGYMVGVWIAFEDCDEDNGPLIYYPGSHMLPEFDMCDVGVEPREEHYDKYEIFIAKVIRELELQPKLATVKKGQAFIWSSNLIHGGGARRDLLRSRHSQVTHVYFEGCRYYTPMMSRGTQICWRHPEWIPHEVPERASGTWEKVYGK